MTITITLQESRISKVPALEPINRSEGPDVELSPNSVNTDFIVTVKHIIVEKKSKRKSWKIDDEIQIFFYKKYLYNLRLGWFHVA